MTLGYEVDRVKYWIATNRYELTGEQIAQPRRQSERSHFC